MKVFAAAALCASVLLARYSGGMTRLAYNNADFVLRKMASDWFDLDPAQSDELKVRMRSFAGGIARTSCRSTSLSCAPRSGASRKA